jgi:hypothetical protein
MFPYAVICSGNFTNIWTCLWAVGKLSLELRNLRHKSGLIFELRTVKKAQSREIPPSSYFKLLSLPWLNFAITNWHVGYASDGYKSGRIAESESTSRSCGT